MPYAAEGDAAASKFDTPRKLEWAEFKWTESARCKEVKDPRLFFDGPETDLKRVILVWCDECPVKQACLEFAIRNKIWDGVWGVMKGRTRRRLAYRRDRTR